MKDLKWAMKEIDYANASETPETNGMIVSATSACSKAYKALLKPDDTEMSIAFKRQILLDLIDNQPLTPITESSQEWDAETGECLRRHGLFKVNDNEYTDRNRFRCVDVYKARIGAKDRSIEWDGAEKLINAILPVSMPYVPPRRRYQVYIVSFVAGEYVYTWALSVENPSGTVMTIDKYFKKPVDGSSDEEATTKEDFQDAVDTLQSGDELTNYKAVIKGIQWAYYNKGGKTNE